MIREMVAAGDSARSEVALLESLERALERLLRTTKGKKSHDHHGHMDGMGSDYECSKHWESIWKSGVIHSPEPITQAASNPGQLSQATLSSQSRADNCGFTQDLLGGAMVMTQLACIHR